MIIVSKSELNDMRELNTVNMDNDKRACLPMVLVATSISDKVHYCKRENS